MGRVLFLLRCLDLVRDKSAAENDYVTLYLARTFHLTQNVLKNVISILVLYPFDINRAVRDRVNSTNVFGAAQV